jgi:hypothetical protein
MTWAFILAVLGWTLLALQTWNVQRALRHGVIRSKGEWHRSTDPTDYWIGLGFAVFSLIFAAALALASMYVILAGS